MRRYLEQIGCVLRPRSVVNADIALRCLDGFLARTTPEVSGLGQVTRRHIEDFKPWLAARPGQSNHSDNRADSGPPSASRSKISLGWCGRQSASAFAPD